MRGTHRLAGSCLTGPPQRMPLPPRGRPLRMSRPAKGETPALGADVRQLDEEIMVNEPAATSIEA
jgi:hypothetical protein